MRVGKKDYETCAVSDSERLMAGIAGPVRGDMSASNLAGKHRKTRKRTELALLQRYFKKQAAPFRLYGTISIWAMGLVEEKTKGHTNAK